MDLLNIAFKNLKLKRKYVILFTIFLSFSMLDIQAQDKPDMDDISIIVQIEGLSYTYNIAALYSTDGKLYVAVEELFQVVIIPCIVNNNGDNLSGFIENEKRPYEINFLTKQIKFDDKLYAFENEMIKNMGMIYLESFAYEKAFGLHLSFNFRSLSIKVSSDFELPILKKQRIEKSRNLIQGQNDEVVIDQTFKRDYHLFRYGNIDWSLMSAQSPGTPIDSRLGLNLGAELLFGEANAYLNFSDRNKPDPRQQQFSWRWVDNEKKIIRQVQAGNISNKTIASINAPVHGAAITNTPTTIRKAKGEYIITDVTQPDWMVELYLNNSMIAFTKADAAGQFSFKVPIIYGYTVLKLKFYGPMGEERLDEKVMNIPASFMPSGIFEYKINGGVLQNEDNSVLARAEGNYGLNRSFTIGGGLEYLSSVKNANYIPFVSFSMLPIRKLILSGEYAYKTRTKVLMNYYLWSGSMLEIDYARYFEGQKAILFNYLEERKIGFSLPMRLRNVSGSTRVLYKQNVFEFFNYNMVELMFSAFYKQFNANLSTNANWITDQALYINTSAALSVRLPNSFSFRPSAQFNVSKMELMSYKLELEKKISQTGFLSASFERNTVSSFNSFNLNFKYDLSFAQTNISVRAVNNAISLMESARGGIAFDDKNKRIFPSQQAMVGRGGIAFIAYVDVNHNNVFDTNERKADFLSVKINGGRPFYSEKDSIIRIMGLEPFLYYNVELNDKDFEFITWRIEKKNLSILIDPNQFKTILIPISPVAEISGMVLFNNDSTEEGLGRVIVNIFDKNGNKAARIITESDGYVNHLGLLPGDYYAEIDSVQMQRLQMIASPAKIDFKIKALLEGDVFTALDFVLRKRHIDKLGLISQDSIKDRLALDSAGMQKKTLLDDKTENIDLLLAKVTQKILFAVGKFAINPIYKQYFLQVVQLMKNYPEIELLLEGLCDNDGSQEFNQKLSVKRATAVRNELIKLGADGKRIEVVGLGSLKPLNSNANAIEKSINRRVEFKLNTKKKTNSENVINKNEIDNLGTNDTAKTIKIAVVKDTNLKVNITKPTDIKKPKDSQIPVDLKNFMDNTCNQPGSYYIQCGVFKNKKAALQLANKLKGNTEIYVGIEVINSLYKVQLGCFTDKAAADKLMQELITKKVCGSMFIGIRK